MTDPAERLEPYRAKRRFGLTWEPPGGADPSAGSRFVIQEHHARRLHWDLRLERDGVLASWAVPKGLPEAPGRNHFAARTEDHPLEYIDFHGEIPPGQYGAGTMTIWDHGTYETLKWEARKIEIALHGERLDARYALFAIGREDDPKDWMVHRMDPPGDPDREPPPARYPPMLARPGRLPPEDAGWAHEIRWEGQRALAYSTPGELRFEAPLAGEVTERYPELSRLNRALGSHQAVLDGVIVAFDPDGAPSPAALAARAAATTAAQRRRLAEERPVTYVIFDLLWLDGRPLLEAPYAERRRRLAGLELTAERWRTPDHVVGQGAAVLEASAAHGLGRVVAKRLDSAYAPGRRGSAWIEVGPDARTGAPSRLIAPTGARTVVSIDGRTLELANLGRVVFRASRTTKREVLDYYAAVAPAILPHLRGRPLTVTDDGRPDWIRAADGGAVIDDLAGLLWLADGGGVEVRAPLARAGAPQEPTAVIFALEPDPRRASSTAARSPCASRGRSSASGWRPSPRPPGPAAWTSSSRSGGPPSPRRPPSRGCSPGFSPATSPT